jgi:hypothetical protein
MFTAVFLALTPGVRVAADPQAAEPSSSAAATPSTSADGTTDSQAADGVVTPERQFAVIRSALSQPRLANLNDDQLRFYVHVTAKQPRFSFADYAKGYDFIHGPTKGGNPMSHAEFLNMITPKELHSSAGITPLETLQGAIVNWLGQKLIKNALDAIKNARSEGEIQDIQDRIDRELAALNASTP